nr:hypothetical protein [uncultured Brevundimonas sp.]
MTAFEFFFSFYGLILGLSVAVIATGAARAFKHRKTVAVGWKTPLLAVFAALDIVTFWDSAWVSFHDAPYSYGLLVAGMVVALIYFVAASLIFPDAEDHVASLDQHFWANKRAVLLLLILTNLLMTGATLWMKWGQADAGRLLYAYGQNQLLYLALIVPAAMTRRAWLFATTVGLHVVIYIGFAAVSIATPERMIANSLNQKPPAAEASAPAATAAP